MMIRIFGYPGCSSCTKAKKMLDQKKLKYLWIDITLKPPSQKMFLEILKGGIYQIKDLLNRSGQMYRQMNMKEKIKKLSQTEIIRLLAHYGKLVKRPIITDGKKYSVGFDDALNSWK